jgi:hypothetical protein
VILRAMSQRVACMHSVSWVKTRIINVLLRSEVGRFVMMTLLLCDRGYPEVLASSPSRCA